MGRGGGGAVSIWCCPSVHPSACATANFLHAYNRGWQTPVLEGSQFCKSLCYLLQGAKEDFTRCHQLAPAKVKKAIARELEQVVTAAVAKARESQAEAEQFKAAHPVAHYGSVTIEEHDDSDDKQAQEEVRPA